MQLAYRMVGFRDSIGAAGLLAAGVASVRESRLKRAVTRRWCAHGADCPIPAFVRPQPGAWRTVPAVAFLALAVLASARPALAQAEIELLRATLTPVRIVLVGDTTTYQYGCNPPETGSRGCTTNISGREFTEDGVTYGVRVLLFTEETGSLRIQMDPRVSTRLQSMTLHVSGKSFFFKEASSSSDGTYSSRTWGNAGMEWAAGVAVPFRLTRPNEAPTAADGEVQTGKNSLYTFAAADFQFADVDTQHGQSLQGVRAVTVPATGRGRFTLNGHGGDGRPVGEQGRHRRRPA